MAKDYDGVKQNKETEKWKYSLIRKGNKRVSTLKYEFDTKKEAAIYREMHILRDILDTEKKVMNGIFQVKNLRN